MSYILIIKYTEIFKLLVLRRVWINSNSPIYKIDGILFIFNNVFKKYIFLKITYA